MHALGAEVLPTCKGAVPEHAVVLCGCFGLGVRRRRSLIHRGGCVAVAQGTARSLGDAALLIGPPLMGYFADVVSAKAALVSNGVMMAVLGILFLLFAREPVRRRGRRVEEEDRKAE